MTLVRFDPFGELSRLQKRAQQIFEADESYGAWSPAVDIFERGDDLVIRLEVPGVEKDAIDISVENNTLTMRGERKREAEINKDSAYRIERSYGSFARSFALPKTVDANGIVATYKNGILELSLPKAEQAKPKKIQIDAA